MKISIITLFPEMFLGPFDHSIIKRAKDKKLLTIEFINIRDFGIGNHKIVDDKPYGGGVGMVLRVDVIKKAIDYAGCNVSHKAHTERIVLLEPTGGKFNQAKARSLTKYDHIILVCGHYEGVDHRVDKIVDEKISIGDYILTGGEIPAMVITDTIVRLLPHVLGKDESSHHESFEETVIDNKKVRILEYPQYTRPDQFNGLKVPNVLLSGNHKKIKVWRRNEALKRTKKERPDLF